MYHIYVEELRRCERQEVRMQVIPRETSFLGNYGSTI